MKYLLIVLATITLTPAGATAAIQPHVALRQAAAAETEFNRLGNKMMSVVQRALSLSTDADAIAFLQKEGSALQQQAEQLRPTYAQWFNGLSSGEQVGVRERMQRSSFASYFGTLETDPQLNARLKGNPQLNQAVSKLLNALDMRVK